MGHNKFVSMGGTTFGKVWLGEVLLLDRPDGHGAPGDGKEEDAAGLHIQLQRLPGWATILAGWSRNAVHYCTKWEKRRTCASPRVPTKEIIK